MTSSHFNQLQQMYVKLLKENEILKRENKQLNILVQSLRNEIEFIKSKLKKLI